MVNEQIVLAVDASSRDLTEDDRHLLASFERQGLGVEARLWGEPIERGSTVVIRSTWDYIERPEQFTAWLDHLDEVGAVVHNPTRMVRWNMHKGYLIDLATQRVPVAPTVSVERGSQRSLDELLETTGWTDVVIKPAVGGTARLTVSSERVGTVAAGDHLKALVANEDGIVQPYLSSITTEGEISIVAIGGVITHAVLKRARPGDWRVQTEFGGTAELIDVDAELIEITELTLAALDSTPTYARIDVVRDQGRYVVLELELVEPELFFRLAPHAAEALVSHLVRRPDVKR